MFRQEITTTRCADARRNVEKRRKLRDELDIQYNQQSVPLTQIDSDDSENQPLISKSPSKISPSELHFSI